MSPSAPPPRPLRIRDLRAFTSFPVHALADELGPFVLIQRPPDPVLQQVAMHAAGAATMEVADRSQMLSQLVLMLDRFDELLVIRPRPQADAQLVMGRAEGCDIQLLEPSVSQRHALLRWQAEAKEAFVRDLGSSNGTFLNGAPVGTAEEPSGDTDTLCLGDVQMMFVLTTTLHAQLRSMRPHR